MGTRTDYAETDDESTVVVAFDPGIPPMMLELAIVGMRSRVIEMVDSLPASQRAKMIEALRELVDELARRDYRAPTDEEILKAVEETGY
jgi:cobalamin biosynthesis protein CobD/CbiB